MALFGQKHGAQGGRQTRRPPLAADARDFDVEADEKLAVAPDFLEQAQQRAADRKDRGVDGERVVEPGGDAVVDRAAPHDKGDAAFLPRFGMAVAEAPQHFGAPALGEAEVVGVIDDAGGVGVFVVDADGMLVRGKAPTPTLPRLRRRERAMPLARTPLSPASGGLLGWGLRQAPPHGAAS